MEDIEVSADDVITAEDARTPELSHALGTTSVLISITVLWVTFTILEALDARLFDCLPRRRRNGSTYTSAGAEGDDEEEDEEGEVLVFCQTGVELGLGLLMLAAWACKLPHPSTLNRYSELIPPPQFTCPKRKSSCTPFSLANLPDSVSPSFHIVSLDYRQKLTIS